ncbi:MAG: B12-binding domain-containing radical SAM protein [Coriobacteriia bacterium]|nr:B12-binding domain-containing radical SAM protein [Coriobacteriia bacterium]
MLGEGETTFADVLHALVAAEPLERVPGIAFRDPDGSARLTRERPPVERLDDLPSPYLTGILAPVDGATYVESYRGCPHACGYCFEGKGSSRIRSFSKERVEAEVALIASTPGVRTFSFVDPVFNLTRERLAWLADVLAPHAARGVRLHTVEVDVERIDDEAAALLVRAGVASVETGPQTTGLRALEQCRRGFDPDRFIAGVEACKRHGIRVEGDLILGLPGDSVSDMLDSMRFCIDLDPGKIQVSTLRVLPGTDFWARFEELGLVFDPEPPHEVVCTREASFVDLRRAEVRSVWLQKQYEARV